MNSTPETTYSLLVRSQEIGRSLTETIIYALLGLSVLVSILQFVQQQNGVPAKLTSQAYEAPRFTQQQAAAVSARKS